MPVADIIELSVPLHQGCDVVAGGVCISSRVRCG